VMVCLRKTNSAFSVISVFLSLREREVVNIEFLDEVHYGICFHLNLDMFAYVAVLSLFRYLNRVTLRLQD
jgi:hypothetical protein